MSSGEVIRDLRVAKGWRQFELAQRLKIHPSLISSYEANRVNIPNFRLKQICDLFGVSALPGSVQEVISYLLEEYGCKPGMGLAFKIDAVYRKPGDEG